MVSSQQHTSHETASIDGQDGQFPALCPACGQHDRIEVTGAGPVRPLRHCARCGVTWGLPRLEPGWAPQDDEETTRRALRRLREDQE